MNDTNYRSGNVPESKTSLIPNKQGRLLKGVFGIVANEVAKAREATDGIVVVIHNPDSAAKMAMMKLGVEVRSHSTTIVGYSCQEAVAALGHDVMTRRWCAAAPRDNQVKVFLVAGDATALLTLNFTGKGVRVEQEPDLHSV
jgi:1-aminocyclopropane-1-carboxylate deaminase/D-cysteine desulfhydrase-like pyridoxal-dependent ACC family enzyme